MLKTLSIATGIAAFSVPGAATAQVVSATLVAQTPLTVTMTSGAQTAQATQPVGPLPWQGTLMASPSPGTAATMNWVVYGNATAYLNTSLYSNVGGPPGSAGPHEVVMIFTATASAPATIDITRESTITPAGPSPIVGIDFGNDGTIELPNMPATVSMPVTLGTTPFAVRVLLASQLPLSNGLCSTGVVLSAQPANNLVVQQTAFGCATTPYANTLPFGPAFLATGVGVVVPSSQELRVLALGLSQQPFLLPTPVALPCLIVPAPDVLFLVPTNISLGVVIPLPAAVRPVTLHAQAIGLSPAGLVTTDAWRASAF